VMALVTRSFVTMNPGVARPDLARYAEHASFGQNCCDASIGSVVLFILHSMPLGACFFQALLTFSSVSRGLPLKSNKNDIKSDCIRMELSLY
jgi:hypothetical protein